MADQSAQDNETYLPRQVSRCVVGVLILAAGALVGWAAAGGTVPAFLYLLMPGMKELMQESRSAMLLLCLSLIVSAFGVLRVIEALRGLPCLIVTRDGIELETLFSVKWIKWESIGKFELRHLTSSDGGLSKSRATAHVVGTDASADLIRERRLTIPDAFLTPLPELIPHVNARRELALQAIDRVRVGHALDKGEIGKNDKNSRY